MKIDTNIAKEWHAHALKIKQDANKIILGQEKAINLVIISLFCPRPCVVGRRRGCR